MSEEGDITVDLSDGVLEIGINRPEKLNGFTPHIFALMSDAYARMEAEEDIRCGLLFAHGKHFTAGLDLPNIAG
ncbi:MAG: enoyl-CoA hydratase-related protein [Sphingomonadales bacterium]